MDISIFDKLYFKSDLMSIEEVFKPYSYSKLGFKSIGDNPFGRLSEPIFENVIYHFSWSDGYDITYDSHTMNEFVGMSYQELVDFDIEVDYSGLKKTVRVNDIDSSIGKIVHFFELEYVNVLRRELLEVNTNVQGNELFRNQLEIIQTSFSDLVTMESEIELNEFQSCIVKHYQSSYKSLFRQLGNAYCDVFPNSIKLFKNSFKDERKGEKKQFGNGLIMADGLIMTPKRANDLLKSLIKHGYIMEGTRNDTFQNLFKSDTSENVITKVRWKEGIPTLKYFINGLHSRGIIKQSGYQKIWKDVVNCFDKKDMIITNKSFSKNSDPISGESQKQIDRILENLRVSYPQLV